MSIGSVLEFNDVGLRDVLYVARHPEVVEHVLATSANGPLPNTFPELFTQLTDSAEDVEGVQSTIRAILNLHGIRQKRRLSSAGIVNLVTDTLDRQSPPGWADIKASWLANKTRLIAALESFGDEHPLAVLQKSSVLTYAHEHILHEARIITDVRPIFKSDADEVIRAIVVHKLLVEYSSGGKHDRIEFTLDAKDVADLSKMCLRREKSDSDKRRFRGDPVEYDRSR